MTCVWACKQPLLSESLTWKSNCPHAAPAQDARPVRAHDLLVIIVFEVDDLGPGSANPQTTGSKVLGLLKADKKEGEIMKTKRIANYFLRCLHMNDRN